MGAFRDWYESIWGRQGAVQSAIQTMPAFTNEESLDTYYKSLPDDVKNDSSVLAAYTAHKAKVADVHVNLENPIKKTIEGLLDQWVQRLHQYDMSDPAKAEETLASLSADVIEICGVAFAVELGLGAIPFTQEGPVSSARVSQLMAWLGFGAVINAVAHDPVKIGLLRPYQDSLESTFRNKRPDERMLLRAYTQGKIDKAFYDLNIAKYGYSQPWADILSETMYRGLTFSNLMQIAKQGLLTEDLATSNLQQNGLKPIYIPKAVSVLMKANQQATDKETAKGLKATAPEKERDLTVAQIQSAYVEGLIKRADAMNMLAALKPVYSKDEIEILLKLADARIKTPNPAKLKHLTLAEYHKAYKAKLISKEEMLARLQGEYTPEDINLYSELLDAGKA